MNDLISRQAAIDAIEEYADRLQMVNWKENPNVPYKVHSLNWCINTIRDLPSVDIDLSDYSDRLWRKAYEQGKADAEPRLNNHEMACIIADLMGYACACNCNGIDEWLPRFCEFANNECPYPVGVACWEQYLKWKGEADVKR